MDEHDESARSESKERKRVFFKKKVVKTQGRKKDL